MPILTIPNDKVEYITLNTNSEEFRCKCGKCTESLISTDLVAKLEKIRELAKAPVIVTSGYRCSSHQQALRDKGMETAKGKSSHEMGIAVDLFCATHCGASLAQLANQAGFKNIGTAETWIHCDDRPGGPRFWTYGTKKA